MLRIAIVGLGPWGLCALERIITTALHGLPAGLTVEVHTVEPGRPGAGVYNPEQPDYLLLNNACGQLSLYPYESVSLQPRYGVGLYDWAVAAGYRWVGDRCVKDPAGSRLEPHHFLPRRVMGEYLNWFYEMLVAEAPASVRVVHHASSAVDLIARVDDRELVCLDNDEWLLVEHVIVTSGHTANREVRDVVPHMHQMSPFPVSAYVDTLPAGTRVGVSGMGLVAVDIVTALTIGRGGQYREEGGSLRYRPSGREPAISLYARGGLPFTAKSVTGGDRTDVYRPAIATPEAFSALTADSDGRRRVADVRRELLPLLFAEMYARYYAQRAYDVGGLAEAREVRSRVADAWAGSRFEDERAGLAQRYGAFDAEDMFFGPRSHYASSEEYEGVMYGMLESDLREAEVPDGRSAVKAASEVFRLFRDQMRSVVEHGGLSLDSYLDFNADIRSRMGRLVAGPPALRSRQFMALMDAGVLRFPFGPAPALGPGRASSRLGGPATRVSSTMFSAPYSTDVDLIIRGHLNDPRIDGSASVLLDRLYREGRVTQFSYGTQAVGSVDLTPDAHPINIDGVPQRRLWMFGVLTEGIRHFNHYIPSPKSRIRAVEDLGACVAEILDSAI